MKKTAIQFILLVMLGLWQAQTQAIAQNLPPPLALEDDAAITEPAFKQSAPSSDMDFILPKEAVDAADDIAPPSPENTIDGDLLSDVDAPEIDQFFSSTKILSPDEEQPELKIEEAAPVIEEVKKPVKKVVRQAPILPAFNYKTVSLPNSLYHRPNSNHNRHLPLAYFKKDWPKLLAEAVKANNVNQLRVLAANGADARGDDDNGVALLIIAARYRRLDAARWLLMQGANPNVNDEAGLTPLHYAAFANNQALISLLLLYKADMQLADNQGLTPEDYAKRNGAKISALAIGGY